jgi:hypothetical protein
MPYSLPAEQAGGAEEVEKDKRWKKVAKLEKAENERAAAGTEKSNETKLADTAVMKVEASSANAVAVTAPEGRHQKSTGISQRDDNQSSNPDSSAEAADAASQSDNADNCPSTAQGDDWDAAMAAEEEGNQWLYACIMCGDGGDVVMCETCPRVYHIDCLGQTRVGRGGWCVTQTRKESIV